MFKHNFVFHVYILFCFHAYLEMHINQTLEINENITRRIEKHGTLTRNKINKIGNLSKEIKQDMKEYQNLTNRRLVDVENKNRVYASLISDLTGGRYRAGNMFYVCVCVCACVCACMRVCVCVFLR